MQRPADLISAAAAALKERADEVNRLNVFPVPDGDTGTNMSLTMEAVVHEVRTLPAAASVSDICHAVTHGSLMGARGNSGVILSQILRGLCEGLEGKGSLVSEDVATAFQRSVTVAFQAVRKPVEGTMLTVVRDVSDAVTASADQGDPIGEMLGKMTTAAFDSVRRTPELLPVLKENGVVDAGGFGLAILLEGFVAAARGTSVVIEDVSSAAAPLKVEPVDDWDDQEYLYCTEFLLFGEDVDKESVHDHLASVGGSELVVGDSGEYKVHVHTNDPGSVLAYVTRFGEVAEVHINNMRRQQRQRDLVLRDESSPQDRKPVGFVAVAAGEGIAQILRSLGVDVVVSGGQTMNPSTRDLVAAIERVPAESVVVLPNNKNIVMAANAAASVADRRVAVVPTTSVPASFAALLAFDGTEEVDQIVEHMTEAALAVRTAEITTAVKDAKSKVGAIQAGDVIGIVDDADIEAVGTEVVDVALKLADILDNGDKETLTLLAGEDLDDDALEVLEQALETAHPDLEIESHRGGQPLYPLIMSAE